MLCRKDTHQTPDMVQFNSHLRLWRHCITKGFRRTEALHVVAIGFNLMNPITRPAPKAGFFVPRHYI